MSFRLSEYSSIKSQKQTASFLFTIYHRQKDLKNARELFSEQTGKTPEEFAEANNFDDNWKLLSYCKLRALELYLEENTTLPAINLQVLKTYNKEYPSPLIQKWEGIAKWLENPKNNKQIVETYFTDAINNLLKEDNGLAIKTLALPIIQCFAIVNNQNPFHIKYNNLLSDLKRESNNFEKYVDEKADLLNHIKNNTDIWERAVSLPFIYA